MYSRIVVPVDLTHLDKIEKALRTAADLALHYGADLFYVGVTAPTPSEIAHNKDEYSEKLEQFAAEESARRKLGIEARIAVSQDPAVDLDEALGNAIKELDADLVVMASHMPTFADHIFASNAGYLASHAPVSVFVVR